MRKPSEKEMQKLPQIIRGHVEDLFHERMDVRMNAANKLGDEKNVEAIPFLERTIKNESEHEYVKQRAIKAITKIGHPNGIPALEHAIKNKNETTVKMEAIDALGEIGHPNAIPALEYITENEKEDVYAKQNAIKAITKIGHPDGIPALVHVLKSKNKAIRKNAIKTIEEISRKLPELKRGDQYYHVQLSLSLIKPSEHPNAFLKLYEYIKETGGKKTNKHYQTYAKQLKQKEGNLKEAA